MLRLTEAGELWEHLKLKPSMLCMFSFCNAHILYDYSALQSTPSNKVSIHVSKISYLSGREKKQFEDLSIF